MTAMLYLVYSVKIGFTSMPSRIGVPPTFAASAKLAPHSHSASLRGLRAFVAVQVSNPADER